MRQLRNHLQSYLVTGELDIQSDPSAIPLPAITESSGLYDAVQEFEKQMILRALTQNHGNKTATAAMLHITRPALYKKLAKYGIDM